MTLQLYQCVNMMRWCFIHSLDDVIVCFHVRIPSLKISFVFSDSCCILHLYQFFWENSFCSRKFVLRTSYCVQTVSNWFHRVKMYTGDFTDLIRGVLMWLRGQEKTTVFTGLILALYQWLKDAVFSKRCGSLMSTCSVNLVSWSFPVVDVHTFIHTNVNLYLRRQYFELIR